MPDIIQAASGRWPELLMDLGGLTPDQLSDDHQPCPACGGTDRYRWDRDDAEGGWFCNRCGGKDHQGGAGSGLDLLMRVRSWDLKEALSAVERHLGIPTSEPARRTKSVRPHRAPDKPPPDAPPPRLGNATAQWCYRDAAGEQLFWIQRFDPAPGRKLFIHRVWLDGQWHYPRSRGVDADPFTCEWPSPRPLYRLPDLITRPDAPVLVVEGEKAADAAAHLFPDHVVVSWSNGSKAIRHVDWQPLAGRTCRLWPDNDKQGREAMASLAGRLVGIGCSVAVADYPADSVPESWDLADAAWSQETAAGALGRVLKEVRVPVLEEPEPVAADAPAWPDPTITAALNGPRPFTCLGFDDGGYFYQPGDTGQVIRIGGGSHNSTNLLRLADIAYWEACHRGKNGPNWQAAISRLFRDQAAAGVYSPDRIRGRGAWWDKGRSVLHLGDRLIVDGATYSITAPPPSTYSYQRLASIEIPDGLQPLDDTEAMELLDIANRFLWEVPASGLLMAGWVALAPICGSLSWRPHIWLTAAAGSGKSALLDRYIGPLLDTMALWPEGNTTEAFIRQELKSDARAVVMDEAESNEAKDRIRIQDILSLARVASSSGRGVIGKGGQDGAAQRFVVRSMFMLCSISTALKQGADQSRFAQLTMRHPDTLPKPERQAHWQALDRDLARFITAEVGHRMLLRSVGLIPVIRESAAVFRRAAADRFDSQRQGDQYGTLLAGAWSLYSSQVPTEAQALKLIDDNDWAPYREAVDQPDEVRCIQAILQHQVRVEGDRGTAYQRTISELVDIANPAVPEGPGQVISVDAAVAHLGRLGLKVENGTLVVHNNAVGLRKILGDTAWSHCWPTVLGRLRGAAKVKPTRFQGLASTARATSLPLASLQA
jgi:putative DNA primase/helicase